MTGRFVVRASLWLLLAATIPLALLALGFGLAFGMVFAGPVAVLVLAAEVLLPVFVAYILLTTRRSRRYATDAGVTSDRRLYALAVAAWAVPVCLGGLAWVLSRAQ